MRYLKQFILSIGLLTLIPFYALAMDVEEILVLKQAPSGVVFEIVSGDGSALEYAIPQMKKDIKRLREKFPGLSVAFVTHGTEQFSLLSKNKTSHAKSHSLVKDLVDSSVDVHVCGTHASWYDHTEEDFVDFIDVSPTGPAQINDYLQLGYILVEL